MTSTTHRFPFSVPFAGCCAVRCGRADGRAKLPVRAQPRARLPVRGRSARLCVELGSDGQTGGGRPEARPGHRTGTVRLREGMSALQCTTCIPKLKPNTDSIAVPRAEPDDSAPLPRTRRCRAGVRAGAPIARPGADALPRPQALHRGAPARVPDQRIALPEGSDRGRRLCAQPDEVNAEHGSRKDTQRERERERERERNLSNQFPNRCRRQRKEEKTTTQQQQKQDRR